MFEDVPPALVQLRDAGFRLGVISNWSWNGAELLHTLELAQHFEVLVISDQVGYLKPHGAIFEHALGLAGVDAAQAVHVGDSVRADVRGALSVGIRPVLIERHTHVHAAPPDNAGGMVGNGVAPASSRGDDASVPVISDLNGLLDLLDVPRPVSLAAF